MRATMIVMVCVFASALLFASNGTDTDAGDKKEPAKPPVADKDKPISIPMDSIYTTSAERGFKNRLVAGFKWKNEAEKAASYHLKVIWEDSHRVGASNIFMVRGEDIWAAVEGTRIVFATGNGADTPPDEDILNRKIESNKLWLVVYLGVGWSTPPKWQFKSMEVHKGSIEFRYSRSKQKVTSGDGIQYFYWVPLPALEKGIFDLKLVDDDRARPVLIRAVDVP